MYITINDEDTNEILKRLSYVSGISSYSLVLRVDTKDDLSTIKEEYKPFINLCVIILDNLFI